MLVRVCPKSVALPELGIILFSAFVNGALAPVVYKTVTFWEALLVLEPWPPQEPSGAPEAGSSA